MASAIHRRMPNNAPSAQAIELLRELSLTSLAQRELERRIVSGEIVAGAKLNEIDVVGTLQAPGQEAHGPQLGLSPDTNSPVDCLCLPKGWATGPTRPARVSMDYRLRKLGQYLRGWLGYFGISQYYQPIPELDEWLRRRVRMCYWKQWRLARTKIRNLRALGVGLKTAIQHGDSSHSYWHMARTPALQQGLSNARLKSQGLVSIKDLWIKAQGYAT